MSVQKSFKILLIDDNKDLHDDFKKILKNTYEEDELAELEAQLFNTPHKPKPEDTLIFNIEDAFQGQEGIDKVRESMVKHEPYSMAFVDIRMPPGLDGIQTAKELWKLDPNLEIVFCSANNDYSLEQIHEILDKNKDFLIINKPFDTIEIKQAAISLCRKWRLKKQLERQILEAKEQLIQSDKMASIGQLAAGVAHEINNPVGFINSNINTLKSYVDDLLKLIDLYASRDALLQSSDPNFQIILKVKNEIDVDYIKEDIINLINESCDGVNRVKKIIQDLKDFSHQGTSEFENYNLNEGILSTLNIVYNQLKYKAEIIKKLSDIPSIEAVGTQINQVVLNMLVNASHAIQDKGTITIETGSDESQVWFRISDTGSGIKESELSKIFDPFFTTKPVGTGTGLGLSLSYGIIQNHHGTIQVNSKEGSGTSFLVSLPIERGKPQETIRAHC